GGGETVDLAAELGPDRPTCSGDHDPAALEVAGDGIEVGFDLVAPEEIGGGDVADVCGVDLAVEQLVHRGEDLARQPRHPPQLGQLGDQLGPRAGYGDEQGVGVGLARGLDQAGAVPDDGAYLGAQVAVGGVVV